MSEAPLQALAQLIARDGGLLAAAVTPAPGAAVALGDQLAGAPRAGAQAPDLALVVEAVYEGYLLHHGEPRVVDGGDRDLALLAGDRLFAAGLEQLAAAGDIDSVRALADVIALSAIAHARGDRQLAAAVWEAGVAEIGWGLTPALQQAKELAQSADPGAAAGLATAAADARAASDPGQETRGGRSESGPTR